MPIGKVSWYNPLSGYGSIESEGGHLELYVDEALLKPLNLHTLYVGQQVEYEGKMEGKKFKITSLKLPG